MGYTLPILEHLAAESESPHPLNLEELIPRWKKAMRSWRSWICTQSRQTMQQIRQGTPLSQLGGYSNAMALRATAAFGYYETEQEVVDAFRTAMFTHKETTAHQGNEFFARVTYRVVHQGLTPREAIEQVAKEAPKFIRDKVKQALDKVDEAVDPASDLSKQEFADDLALTSMARLWDVGKTEPIKVGKASPTTGTLPGSIYFIVKYQGNFEAAAVANAMVGGDNASRSIAVGAVLGAYLGVEAIPAKLKDTLNAWKKSEKLLSSLPLLADKRSEL